MARLEAREVNKERIFWTLNGCAMVDTANRRRLLLLLIRRHRRKKQQIQPRIFFFQRYLKIQGLAIVKARELSHSVDKLLVFLRVACFQLERTRVHAHFFLRERKKLGTIQALTLR